MGEGLGLKGTEDEPLSGSLVAYAAGTGILVFIDLVAEIGWHKIVKAHHGGSVTKAYIDKDFKFVFNVQFRN